MGVVTGPLDARVWHQKTELNLAPDFAKMAAAMATPIMPSVLAPVPLAFSDSVLGTAATSGSHPTPSDLAKSSFPPMLAFSTGPCPVAYPVTHPSVGPVPMSFTVPSASPKARYGSSTSRAQLSLSPLATRPATAMASFGQKEAVPSTRIDAQRPEWIAFECVYTEIEANLCLRLRPSFGDLRMCLKGWKGCTHCEF